MSAICRTTRKSMATCTCSRCKPNQEVRYGFVAKRKESNG